MSVSRGALIEEAAQALWRLSPVGRLIDNPLSDLDADQQAEYLQMAEAVLAVVVPRVEQDATTAERDRIRGLLEMACAVGAFSPTFKDELVSLLAVSGDE